MGRFAVVDRECKRGDNVELTLTELPDPGAAE